MKARFRIMVDNGGKRRKLYFRYEAHGGVDNLINNKSIFDLFTVQFVLAFFVLLNSVLKFLLSRAFIDYKMNLPLVIFIQILQKIKNQNLFNYLLSIDVTVLGTQALRVHPDHWRKGRITS